MSETKSDVEMLHWCSAAHDARKERDDAWREVSELKRALCAVKAERDEAQARAVALSDRPAPIRGLLVQDRITKEGPWVVVGEPNEHGQCRIYRGMRRASEPFYAVALEPYEPPAEPPPKPLKPAALRALLAAAGVLAVLVPAALLGTGVL